MKFAVMTLIITGMVGMLLTIDVQASTTIYVDSHNNGSEDGSQAHPFNSIQEGIDYASNGDTILVSPGTYRENIFFPPLKPGLILRSQMGASATIIDGQNLASVVTMMDSATIEGFTVRNGGGSTGSRDDGYGIVVNADNSVGMVVNIHNNVVTHNNVRGGIGLTANLHPVDISATISHNRIYDNSGVEGGLGGGISLAIETGTPGTINIYNNLIYVNSGFSGGGLRLGAGVYGAINVINNSVYDNTASFGGGAISDATNLSLINNIFFANTAGEGNDLFIGPNALAALISHNIIGDGQFQGNNGNLAVDPLFVNAAAGDFNLQFNSPAIDSGTSVFVVDDFYGDKRPYDGGGLCGPQWDIGADEYHPSVDELENRLAEGTIRASLPHNPQILGLHMIYLPIISC